MFPKQTIIIILCLLLPTKEQECFNDFGEPVDWLYAYKLPIIKNHHNRLLREGTGYVYITSKNPNAKWTLSEKSVNDRSSFLGQTLSPLYSLPKYKKLMHLMYNDDPPSKHGISIYGHAKGVVITDDQTGAWLIHSSPRFPIEILSQTKDKSKKPKFNGYFYPTSATKYGQSFLCITLNASEMNTVGTVLEYVRPNVYSSNVPDNFLNQFFNLTSVTKKKYIKSQPYYHKADLTTRNGLKFTSYAKTAAFNKDLYKDWLAGEIKSDLQVETWPNGPKRLPSDCDSNYHVMDIQEVELAFNNETVKFKTTKDHSKWVVTSSEGSSVVCVGDINRMVSQYKRGGGTVCFNNAFVWKNYKDSVQAIEPCPRKTFTDNDVIHLTDFGYIP